MIEEKKAKEDQGVRDAGQIEDLRLFSRYSEKLPRPRKRAFSCLDARKEAKEDQGVRDAGQIWPGTYLEVSNLRESGLSTILDVPGKTSSPSEEGLSFFCFFSFLKERKEGPIRKQSKTSHVSENKRSPVEWTGGLSGLP